MMTATVRALPATDHDSHAFWTGGARNELLIERCIACAYLIHPPTGFCPNCESRETAPHAVSGRAVVTSYTVNHKQWLPGLPVPYVLALVELVEQADVRLATNIVGCAPDAVFIGMPVSVRFEPAGDLWIPLFAPAEAAA